MALVVSLGLPEWQLGMNSDSGPLGHQTSGAEVSKGALLGWIWTRKENRPDPEPIPRFQTSHPGHLNCGFPRFHLLLKNVIFRLALFVLVKSAGNEGFKRVSTSFFILDIDAPRNGRTSVVDDVIF